MLTPVVTPVLAVEGPTPGTYTTLNGDLSGGVFSESWVDPPYDNGVVNNTIHIAIEPSTWGKIESPCSE